MLLANAWKDYELIDCSHGLKKERWGHVILLRPDPQIFWQKKGDLKKDCSAIYERSATGGGQWNFLEKIPENWTINYKHLKFKIRPTDFKHTGLFPEQAVNWDWMMEKITQAARPINVLNLFAYTGAASVACASAGANVTHVDASKGIVQWCKDNANLSKIPEDKIRYIIDDCLKFVLREQKREKYYDAIIMDPPSYGRGKDGETWKVEKHLFELVEESRKLLSKSPLFFLINSYTTGMSPTVLQNILKLVMPKGEVTCGELGIPIRNDQLILPCGIYSRWENGKG
jgi:23S rRNA (cytosine1962-C5)-methyltransferase